MPRVCTICKHPGREGIDASLVAQEPLRNIAGRFGVSLAALSRHETDHLPQHLLKAEEDKQKRSAKTLLEQLDNLHTRTLSLLDKAEKKGKSGDALRAIHQARENIKLMAQLVGELPVEGTTNLHLNSQWLELRTIIITALLPHPEARQAVLKALGDPNAKG